MKLNRLVKLTIALEDSGPETILQLLKKCKTSASRRELFKALEITNIDLKKLVKTFNLMQIEGIGEKEVEMLKTLGVTTTNDLSKSNIEAIYSDLVASGEKKGINIPSKEELVKWIEQAKSLVPKSEV